MPRELPWPAVVRAPRFSKRMWEGPYWEGVWPCLDPWDSVRLHTASTRCRWWLQKRCCQTLLSLRKRSRRYALIGLHLLAAEGEDGSSDIQSRDLGDTWRYGCPALPGIATLSHGQKAKALLLSSAITTWKALLRLWGKTSQVEKSSLFLEDFGTCKGGLELPHRLGYVQEMHEAW